MDVQIKIPLSSLINVSSGITYYQNNLFNNYIAIEKNNLDKQRYGMHSPHQPSYRHDELQRKKKIIESKQNSQ